MAKVKQFERVLEVLQNASPKSVSKEECAYNYNKNYEDFTKFSILFLRHRIILGNFIAIIVFQIKIPEKKSPRLDLNLQPSGISTY